MTNGTLKEVATEVISQGENIVKIIDRETAKIEKDFLIITKDKLDLGQVAKHAVDQKKIYDEKVADFDARLNKLTEEFNIAEPGLKETLQIQLNELTVQKQEASTLRDQYSQRLDQANKIQPVMAEQLRGYDSIIKSLRNMRERIQVKVTYYENVLPAIQDAYTQMITVEGGDKFEGNVDKIVEHTSIWLSKIAKTQSEVDKKNTNKEPISDDGWAMIRENIKTAKKNYDEMNAAIDEREKAYKQ
jgi:hypothetical protein